ncbi:TetR/AcrR family transcriptional regulator [Mycolicibacterium diernhoferi]|uniref:TetR family transcriptional regulator n=2 Tax=Mycolicibacterium diernhoferi TaxID=1801 RepID=A0A1Q4H616_9MYCO|nr:TetR/AcrR family transcriptional regulator C-terminal domain-containing protein [Mycolicibacterium diernhoferi]OJZ62905.1 TetR family transcriptional regulator [Mycolicibacterium diernhoferi]OPE54937.1 TetR family transcriptional regulator [Mycolicibacterium diernhoferi]
MATGNEGERPRRGRPPRIDRARIVAAARAIAPEDLTMQAVADALGVDRTTLNYYVGDREGLLELVVADLFDAELRDFALPADAHWADVLRAYGKALHRGVVHLRATAAVVQLRGANSLALAERVLAALAAAGFSAEDGGHILSMVSGVAYTAARDLLGGDHSRSHHTSEVTRVLGEVAAGRFPLLGDVIANRAVAGTADDFEFSLDVVIDGLQLRLSRQQGTT